MAVIRVVNENGELEERRVGGSSTSIVVEGGNDFDPAVVQRIEYDDAGQMSTISTVCGETENRRETSDKPDITLEGIVTESQLPDLKNISNGDRITLLSDIEDGDVIVRRVTVEQTADLVEFVPDGGTAELAFSFQLQLQEP